MTTGNRHIIGTAKLVLKGAFISYFVCFFIGINLMQSMLPLFECSTVLCEEFEEGDINEKEKTDDENRDDKIEFYLSDDQLALEINLKGVYASSCQLNYSGFQHEVPDPPPEFT